MNSSVPIEVKDQALPGPARPPLATSLASLANLFSWGAGGEKKERDDQPIDDTTEQPWMTALLDEGSSGARGGSLAGRSLVGEPARKATRADAGRSKLADRKDSPAIRDHARGSLARALEAGRPENKEATLAFVVQPLLGLRM